MSGTDMVQQLRNALSRTLAALETPRDLSDADRKHLVEDAGALLQRFDATSRIDVPVQAASVHVPDGWTIKRDPKSEEVLVANNEGGAWFARKGTQFQRLLYDLASALLVLPPELTANPEPGDLPRLRDLCERAGITLVQATEPEVVGRWDWGDEHGNASDMSLLSEREAALQGLEAKYGEDWRYEVANGDTRRSFLDHVESELEQVEHELSEGMKP